eukprot:gene141-biopygen131
MPPGADNHSYIEGVYSDVCDAYVRQPGAYVDEGEQRRLREVFSRFRAVKDAQGRHGGAHRRGALRDLVPLAGLRLRAAARALPSLPAGPLRYWG